MESLPRYSRSTALISAMIAALSSPLTLPPAFAQQGDKKGQLMIDPIPADQIPPSPYLNLEDALRTFQLPEGYVIEPVASGSQVDLSVALAFDANGRAWSCEMRSYMPDIDGKGELTANGRIRVLEDRDGDGQIDHTTTFLDGLILPRAVAVTSDGCLYTSADTLYFIRRNGLQAVGEPLVVDRDYAKGGNPEHKANGLLYGHDNWYYNAKSNKRYRRIQGKWLKESTNFRGQWGIAKDNAGRLFHNNNSTLLIGDQFRPNFFRGHAQNPTQAKMEFRLGSNRVHPIRITPGVNRAYIKGTLDQQGKLINTTSACGIHIYRGDNFPANYQEMAFSCEPVGELVKAIQVKRDPWGQPSGSHPLGKQEFIASTDEWFLPCNLYTGPDGTLWVVDMYFGLIQHKAYMTSYLRKQYLSRGLDQPQGSTGRIYRVRYAAKPTSLVPKMEGLKAKELLPYLRHANGLHRDTAQRLIVESGDLSVLPQLTALASDNQHPLAQIHGLWTLEGLGQFPGQALIAALNSQNNSNISSDVAGTALDIIAIHRLHNPELLNTLRTWQHNSRTLHGQIRALAAIGAFEEALQLTLANIKTPLVREALVSGIGTEVPAFLKQYQPVTDKTLATLLAKASHTRPPRSSRTANRLKGKDKASFQRGKIVYTNRAACFGCHGADGTGLANLAPPLARSEWVTGNSRRLTQLLLHGMTGPIRVDNTLYQPALAMPGLAANKTISDQDLADVMTYIRNDWGNRAKAVDAELVKKVRSDTKARNAPYTAKELRK